MISHKCYKYDNIKILRRQKQICRKGGGEDHEANDCTIEFKNPNCEGGRMSRSRGCEAKKERAFKKIELVAK